MTKEVIVESFELDHTAVKAPYVRLIGEETGSKGDIISNFDIRLVQPNENAIPTAGLHTIEHLLAMLIRKRIDGMQASSRNGIFIRLNQTDIKIGNDVSFGTSFLSDEADIRRFDNGMIQLKAFNDNFFRHGFSFTM